jgi:transposase
MPTAAREKELTDRLWERVRPLLPPPTPRPKGGRPRADDRACFEGIVHVLRTGVRWRDLPEGFPSPATCWRRHRDWTEAGVWAGVWQAVLDELDRKGRVRADEVFVDATFVPAAKGGTRSARPRSARA